MRTWRWIPCLKMISLSNASCVCHLKVILWNFFFFFLPTYICTGAHQVSSGEGLFTYHVDTRKVLCLDPGTVARICNPSAWEAD